jgi:peroxiredoxin
MGNRIVAPPGKRAFPWTILALNLVGLAASAIFIFLSFGPEMLFRGEIRIATPLPVVFAELETPSEITNLSFLKAGEPSPDFTLGTLDGGQITLSSLRGHPVLINFWASWCVPCRLETPELVRAFEAHKAEGLTVLGVNMTSQDVITGVRAFVQEFDVTYPVLLDESGDVSDKLYHVVGIPTSIFVDQTGAMVRVQIGAMTGEQIEAFIQEILTTA